MLFQSLVDQLSDGLVNHQSGIMDPEWQQDPVGWISQYLGVREHTIRWSLNPGYDNCRCVTCGPKHEGPHKWDGTPDPIAAILEALAANQNVGVESATGTGKAQPVDEPVLTPYGWRPIGTLRPGDTVFSARGQPSRVLEVYPQGTKPVYRLLFSDGASTRSCDEHLWTVRTRSDKARGRPWRTLELAELRKTLHREWQIPVLEPIKFPEAKLPVEPYLLGVLLGDGSISTNSLAFSTTDDYILERVRATTPTNVVKREGDEITWGLTTARGQGNPLLTALRQVGLLGCTSEDKFVPSLYLRGSCEQRLALLQGLMDTDGSVDKKSGCSEFVTSSPALAEDVRALTRSLGGTATLHISKSYLNGTRHKDRYRVMVKLPNGMNPFGLPRKAQYVTGRAKYPPVRILRDVQYAGEAECVCILVDDPDRLYVTNDYIVTHNTFIGAATALWFASVFPNSLVVTTAPKEQQLMLHLWKELGRNWNQFQIIYPQATLTKLQVKMNPPHMDWLITGFACGVGADEQSATKAQGFHAEHMLIITEETPGIHSAVMTAFENTCTGDHNLRLAFGNPDHEEDALHKFCLSPTVTHVRISGLDHPNVVCDDPGIVPGAVSRRNIEERRLKYGPDSNIFRSRVRGICPAESADSLIKRSWCLAAVDRYNDPTFRQGIPALGVDVANSAAGDEAAIARGEGACCLEVVTFPCPDANKLGTRVALEMGAYNIDERNVGVDAIGVGAGTVNELRRLRYEVQDLQSAAAPLPQGDLTEEFGNLRAQMWWKTRLDLQHNRIAMPDDEDLVKDLTAPMWEVRNGKIYLEEKKKIKARIGRSPNKGDAFVYWNWVREPLSSVSKGGRLVTF